MIDHAEKDRQDMIKKTEPLGFWKWLMALIFGTHLKG